MPTLQELEALVKDCEWKWTTEGGHEGYWVTDANSNSIFLPAAGCRVGSSLIYVGMYGNYWSSSLHTSYSYRAYTLNFTRGYHCVCTFERFYGQSVRLVTE